MVSINLIVCAQEPDSLTAQSIPHIDSSKNDLVKRVKEVGKIVVQKSVSRFAEEKMYMKRQQLIDELQIATNKAKDYLKHGIDTVGIYAELEDMKYWRQLAGDGVLTKQGRVQSQRNLVITNKMLVELLNRTEERKKQLDKYEKDLMKFRFVIDSLNSDTALYSFTSDSASLIQYQAKYIFIARTLDPTDSALKNAITQVYHLQAK